MVRRLAEKYQGKIKVVVIDVGDQSFSRARNLSAQFGFRGVPTLMIFKGGRQRFQSQRGGDEAELVREIERALRS